MRPLTSHPANWCHVSPSKAAHVAHGVHAPEAATTPTSTHPCQMQASLNKGLSFPPQTDDDGFQRENS